MDLIKQVGPGAFLGLPQTAKEMFTEHLIMSNGTVDAVTTGEAIGSPSYKQGVLQSVVVSALPAAGSRDGCVRYSRGYRRGELSQLLEAKVKPGTCVEDDDVLRQTSAVTSGPAPAEAEFEIRQRCDDQRAQTPLKPDGRSGYGFGRTL